MIDIRNEVLDAAKDNNVNLFKVRLDTDVTVKTALREEAKGDGPFPQATAFLDKHHIWRRKYVTQKIENSKDIVSETRRQFRDLVHELITRAPPHLKPKLQRVEEWRKAYFYNEFYVSEDNLLAIVDSILIKDVLDTGETVFTGTLAVFDKHNGLGMLAATLVILGTFTIGTIVVQCLAWVLAVIFLWDNTVGILGKPIFGEKHATLGGSVKELFRWVFFNISSQHRHIIFDFPEINHSPSVA